MKELTVLTTELIRWQKDGASLVGRAKSERNKQRAFTELAAELGQIADRYSSQVRRHLQIADDVAREISQMLGIVNVIPREERTDGVGSLLTTVGILIETSSDNIESLRTLSSSIDRVKESMPRLAVQLQQVQDAVDLLSSTEHIFSELRATLDSVQ